MVQTKQPVKGGARVLVVDDDPHTLQLMSMILGSVEVATMTADNATSALSLLRAAPDLDVVVSDIHMPGKTGVEFLATVRAEFRDRPWLQIILITGQATVETAVAAMRLEASDYLFKPVDSVALRDAVLNASKRARSIREMRDLPADSPQARQLAQIVDTARGLAQDMRRSMNSLRPAGEGATTESNNLHTLALLQNLENARSTMFGDAVMPEPAWEMLAELMRAELQGKKVSITSLAQSSKSPMTTALRRVDDMLKGGLLERQPDPSDRRRTNVILSAEGRARMQVFLEGFAATALGAAAPASGNPRPPKR